MTTQPSRLDPARAIGLPIALAATLALLGGCGTSSTGGRKAPTTSPPGSASAQPAAPASGNGPVTAPGGHPTATRSSTPGNGVAVGGRGCPAGGRARPSGAGVARTVDLDHDGRADRIWLAHRSGARLLGVSTAGGARFSTSFTGAAPSRATAVAGRLGDGSAIILLDLGREARVYSVIDCRLVATVNPQGRQYTFDRGFTGFGSGAGCPIIGSGRRLVGYLARPSRTGTTWTVTRTTIRLSRHGARASNGVTTTVGSRVPASSSIVTTARAVSCGDGARAQEP